ncbi:MAG: hypothetical protein RLP44_19140 [Aggregatilineales bacterium]
MSGLRIVVVSVLMLLTLQSILAQDTANCPLSAGSRLQVGGVARVTPGDPNNVRASADRNSELIGQIPGEAAFQVLDGPVCADGFVWWQVDYAGLIGWTVEGSATAYWIEPLTPTPSPMMTATPFIQVTASHTPTPTATATETPTATPTPTLEPIPTRREVITADNADQLTLVGRFAPTCDSPDELMFDASGDLLAIHCDPNIVLIWDVATGMIRHQIELAGRYHTELAFSPTDPMLLAISSPAPNGATAHLVELWDLTMGEPMRQARLTSRIEDLLFSPDGTQLVIAQAEGVIRVLSVDNLGAVEALSHSSVHTLKFLADGQQLASIDDDAELRIWDWETKELLNTYSHVGIVFDEYQLAVFNHSFATYAFINLTETNSYQKVLYVRNMLDDSLVTSPPEILQSEEGVILDVIQPSPIERGLLVWADTRMILSLWNYETDSEVVEIDLLNYMQPEVRVLAESGVEVRTSDYPRVLAISPDGTLIAFAGIEVEILAVPSTSTD